MQHFDPSQLVSHDGPIESRASLELPTTSIANPATWLLESLGGAPSTAGPTVTPRTAMNLAAVFACVRLLAETIGSLPLSVYERVGSDGKRIARDHPLHPVLHDEPNPQMSSMTYRETKQGHLGLWGNAFSEIVRDAGGRPVELWPLRPEAMKVTRQDGVKRYTYTTADGTPVPLEDADVLHVPALGHDGVIGYSPIELARQVFGNGLATQEFAARFYANGANGGGVLETKKKLSDVAYNRLRDSFAAKQQGLGNSHKPMILEDETTWKPTQVPPEAAQFLETREFSVEEICRWYNVPPHLVQHLKRATFGNIEHQAIQFVVYCIRPWIVRWEQEINRKLFTRDERLRYFAAFNVDGLLRGDVTARATYYREQFNIGAITQNEIRALENRNPIDNGDTAYVPLNMVSSEAAGKAPAAGGGGGGGRAAAAAATRAAMRPVFADALNRVSRREVEVLGRAAKRSDGTLATFAARFFQEHRDYVRAALWPAASACGLDVDAIATAYAERTRDELLQAADAGAVAGWLEQWPARVDRTVQDLAGETKQ